MRSDSIYSLHPGFAMEAAAMRNLRERTGRTLDEWLEIVGREGPPGQKERAQWLKAEHGLTTNYASWVAGRSCGDMGADSYDPDAYVEAMFSGKKAALLPLYDELLRIGRALGPDVTVCPTSTTVPLYRKHVFALIKPTTNTRLDLGLSLRGVSASGRLVETGGEAKGDRITHRIPVSAGEDIDDELTSWLARAYRGDQRQ